MPWCSRNIAHKSGQEDRLDVTDMDTVRRNDMRYTGKVEEKQGG